MPKSPGVRYVSEFISSHREVCSVALSRRVRARSELERHLNDIGVRSFILTGAPFILSVQPAGPFLIHMFTVSSALAGDEQDE